MIIRFNPKVYSFLYFNYLFSQIKLSDFKIDYFIYSLIIAPSFVKCLLLLDQAHSLASLFFNCFQNYFNFHILAS
jgi:hypothetical protein